MELVTQGLDGPTEAEVSKSPLAQGLDKNAMIVNHEERVFMHCPDTRISRSECAEENY